MFAEWVVVNTGNIRHLGVDCKVSNAAAYISTQRQT